MDLRYPIGKFECHDELTQETINLWIDEVKQLPALLKDAVGQLTEEQLNTPYRPDGWTVKQVVHHLADSHMNIYIRTKLALTEDTPTIKPYDEVKWAELVDYNDPIEPSLLLLDSIHKRWTNLLDRLTFDQLKRTFVHPESGEMSIGKAIGFYAWHGKHHLAHITSLCDRLSWSQHVLT